MFNAYQIFIDGELYCIAPTEARARMIGQMITGLCMESKYKIVGIYIPNIGF